jgi:ABC-type multidrug transport system ATPase subunit
VQRLGSLESHIRRLGDAGNLQLVDGFMAKVVQLHHTLEVRFGVTLVGPSGGGKSTTWKLLAAALTEHNAAEGVKGPIKFTVLNPKSISTEVRPTTAGVYAVAGVRCDVCGCRATGAVRQDGRPDGDLDGRSRCRHHA